MFTFNFNFLCLIFHFLQKVQSKVKLFVMPTLTVESQIVERASGSILIMSGSILNSILIDFSIFCLFTPDSHPSEIFEYFLIVIFINTNVI